MLSSIETALRQAGIETHRAPASSAVPVEQLGLALAADAQGRPRQLWITLLPGLAEQLAEGVNLVQFLAELPFRPTPGVETGLAGLILMLNNVLPLGGFGLRQPEGVIWFRYTLVAGPNAAGSAQAALETVLLVSYLLDRFSGILEPVAAGHKTLAQAGLELEGGWPAAGLN